jgi:hypothetical protein
MRLKSIQNRCRVVLSGLSLCLLLNACQISQEEMESWAGTASGPQKIAAYLSESERPIDARKSALKILFDRKEFGLLLTVIQSASPEQKEVYLQLSIDLIDDLLKDTNAADIRTKAVEYAFYLMGVDGAKALFSKRIDVIEDILAWTLFYLKTGEDPKLMSSPSEIFIGVSTLDPQKALSMVEAKLKEFENQIPYVVTLANLLLEMKSVSADQIAARSLFNTAQIVHPQITEPLIKAMIGNANPTLLKYLLEIVRDDRVSKEMRELALSSSIEVLQKDGIENLMRILESDRADRNHVFYALRRIWDYGRIEKLGEALGRFNPDFQHPVSGQEMKKEVEDFCNFYVVQGKQSSRELLEKTLVQILVATPDPSRWVTRLYTLGCLFNLYPDDFNKIVKADGGKITKLFEKDQTAISGWESGRLTKMSEIFKRFVDPK